MSTKKCYRCLVGYELLGWECVQKRPKRTRQEHQEGVWGGGQKARKPTHSLSSLSDKRRMFLATGTWTEATDLGFPVVITLHGT